MLVEFIGFLTDFWQSDGIFNKFKWMAKIERMYEIRSIRWWFSFCISITRHAETPKLVFIILY